MAIVKLDGYKCERCSHTWVPRSNTEGLPIICPKCKTPYWNRPRKSNIPKKSTVKKSKIKKVMVK